MASAMTPVAKAAAQLQEAYRSGEPVHDPVAQPMTRAEAYAIQDQVLVQIGPAGAWKVGRNAKHPDPYIAPVPQSMITPSDEIRSLPQSAQQMGVESELGFRLSKPVQAGAPPVDRAASLGHVGHVVPLLELLHSRLPKETVDDA